MDPLRELFASFTTPFPSDAGSSAAVRDMAGWAHSVDEQNRRWVRELRPAWEEQCALHKIRWGFDAQPDIFRWFVELSRPMTAEAALDARVGREEMASTVLHVWHDRCEVAAAAIASKYDRPGPHGSKSYNPPTAEETLRAALAQVRPLEPRKRRRT